MNFDHRTRDEEVPEFLSCGHNAHWKIWHSLAKGKPCILCRAERAELQKQELSDLITVKNAQAVELMLQIGELKEAANDLLNGLRIAARDLEKVNKAAAQDALDCLRSNEERARRFSEKRKEEGRSVDVEITSRETGKPRIVRDET